VRAISLWQPWASAWVIGVKGPETRGWSTHYRGPLAVHAAVRWTADQREFAATEHTLGRLPERLPLGAIVGVVDLVDVKPTDEAVFGISPVEKLYGDYSPGRFAWFVENCRPLPEPIPFRGHQSFFAIPDDLLPVEFRPRVLL